MRRTIIFTLMIAALPLCMSAQPQRRLQEKAAADKNSTGVTLTIRAKTQYTAQTTTPTEISWKRDIYRELDLKKEANAALYYPEEPLGDRVNFFTLVFNLILEGKINAYEYRLDGNELFTEENKLDIENLLDKFYIYYQKKDGKYIVEPADIPSAEVLKYYIKESNFLDQRASNYQTRVTAICPVQMRQDIGDATTSYPMFWLDYDEISPYLAQTQVMTSSFNNTTNMSLDDYFVMRRYDGDIYKTSNLRNQPLAEYCENDTILKAEQQRIERQLVDFESGLWASSSGKEDEEDEAENAKAGKKSTDKKEKPGLAREKSSQPKEKTESSKPERQKTVREKPQKAPKSSSSERVSVHRR